MASTMAQAKREFTNGYLTKYRIERRLMTTNDWFVHLGSGNAAGWLVDARTKEPRAFKTLDAAVKAVEEVGFRVETLS